MDCARAGQNPPQIYGAWRYSLRRDIAADLVGQSRSTSAAWCRPFACGKIEGAQMQDVIADLRKYFGSQLRIANSETLDADFPLVKRGVLDSIELMQVVAFVEKTYGVAIDDTEIVPENLGSLTAIAALVERKRQQRGR